MYPVILQIGNFQLGSYTLMAAIGGAVFFILLRRYCVQMGLRNEEEYWLLVNVIAISAFIGAKAFYLLSFPTINTGFSMPVFSINSGFSASGFFFGLICGVWLFSLKLKLDFLRIMDRICMLLPFWQAFGKGGCFLHGCCYGIPASADLPWAVRFSSPLSGVPDTLLGVALHPVQLYEAASDFFLGVALILISKNLDRSGCRKGLLSALYLIFYGIIRFSLDFFRSEGGIHSGAILGLVMAGLMISSGILVILKRD
ncbi:MAG: prolipoprotein diacylglyceryl transferase [Elusimicrobiota bacterium]